MKKIGLFIGPFILLVVLVSPPPFQLSREAWNVIGLAAIMLIWWVTEAVPIAVTSLLPIVLLPAMQIYGIKTAAAPYASPIVFLFMGGFMLALAMERWNLHRRIALNIVRITGTNANGIILGFMLATAFLSMWISNTATTVMMLPIAVSVIDLLISDDKNNSQNMGTKAFAVSLMIGIAYAANIGGTATLVGTPPNVVFAGFLERSYDIKVDFANWMLMAFPFALLLLLITYFMLTKVLFANHLGKFAGASDLIQKKVQQLGNLSRSEAKVLVVFILTALAWITKKHINHGLGLVKANGDIELTDHMIAIFATLALFIIPSDGKKDRALLEWKDTERLPWGILLLFGGGLSLADALRHVGLIDLIGAQFSGLSVSGFIIILGLTAVSLFLTEVMSNVALVTVFLPVVAAVAIGMDINLLYLCIPVTLTASCAFMLPMSTPPNAIVFASGKIQIKDMVKAGLVLNIIAIILIAIWTNSILPLVF